MSAHSKVRHFPYLRETEVQVWRHGGWSAQNDGSGDTCSGASSLALVVPTGAPEAARRTPKHPKLDFNRFGMNVLLFGKDCLHRFLFQICKSPISEKAMARVLGFVCKQILKNAPWSAKNMARNMQVSDNTIFQTHPPQFSKQIKARRIP